MKRLILLFFILNWIVYPNSINASSTNKNNFPYEITNISIDENFITIDGWGMVVNKHHYNSSSTHDYELKLISSSEVLSYYSKPIELSQTEIMRYLGVRKCNPNEYYKRGTVCYYNYDYVGFEFKVPLSDLNIDENYESKLVIHSNILNFIDETYIFYPMITPLIQINDVYRYEVISNLYETSLIVADFGVYEREGPTKMSKIRQTDKMCNAQFAYNRYFDKGSIYMNVFDHVVADNTTFYKVKTSKNTVCKLGRNVTSEGSDYYSYIPTNYVDFDGESMVISIKDINQAPIIDILYHPIITIDEVNSFDFRNYIKSSDFEDGDITYKTNVSNKADLSVLGTHKLNLEVEDSHGKKSHNTLNVSVIEGNKPPIIYASDITIYQYEEFDYLENVSAIDHEDGNITYKLKYSGYVNTNILGTYNIKYNVTDSKNKTTIKTIQVHVIKNPKEKIRFISLNTDNLFYNTQIPINWKYNIQYLIEQLNNPKIFHTNKYKY